MQVYQAALEQTVIGNKTVRDEEEQRRYDTRCISFKKDGLNNMHGRLQNK